MFEQILVLCTGNVCRSPLAAAMLKKRLPEKRIESAGLAALAGSPVDEHCALLARNDALELREHRARQVTAQMLRDSDLILVMTEGQRGLLAMTQPAVSGKTLLFGRWLIERDTGKEGLEIPDPYQRGPEAARYAYALLSAGAESWQERLKIS